MEWKSGFTLANMWDNVRTVAAYEDVLSMTIFVVVMALLLMKYGSHAPGRVRTALGLFGCGLLLLLVASITAALGMVSEARIAQWVALICGGIALVNLLSMCVFDAAFPRLRIATPRLLRDLLVALAYISVGFIIMGREGVSLSGLITTSAVLTAVIGFALQDTLGNIMGGLALQLEKSINVGDWLRMDPHVGRVKEIRWRHTAIETRDWDTVIIPNSFLMKGQVVVLGRRTDQPVQHRQWLYFNVDFRVAPTEVIAAVNHTLQATAIERVAREPKPHCVFFDFKESYCQYAVRYWLTDIGINDPTDSAVRTRIYFALKRRGIPLSIPAQSVFMTEETEMREHRKWQRELEHRLAALENIDLFQVLTDGERRLVAERLSLAPFTQGELLMQQGTEGHWLYILTKGSAAVQLTVEGDERTTIATIHTGDFCGEMSLMTGERRSATVVALEEVESYRLDKESFHDILAQRPELAEYIADVLARRRVNLSAAREGLDARATEQRVHTAQHDLVTRILSFFGLRETASVSSS